MANIKNRKKLQLIQTIWDVMLYSQHFTFHWKLLVLVSRIEKSGTGDNNFGKWKGTFRSDRPKWPDRSQWTTFKASPEYSGRTKQKWSVPFDEPTEICGILGWMESAPGFPSLARFRSAKNFRWFRNPGPMSYFSAIDSWKRLGATKWKRKPKSKMADVLKSVIKCHLMISCGIVFSSIARKRV